MTMKTLKMYLMALLVVFVASSMMYGVAKMGAKKTFRGQEERIQGLEAELSRCKAVYKEVDACAASTKELLHWKELAEQCVAEKVGIPGQP
jgi:Tfp pilus assembly protein PilN